MKVNLIGAEIDFNPGWWDTDLMNIIFESLRECHFSLLLKWLEAPHVKAWWDQDIAWTPELVETKFSSYVKGYKIQGGAPKEIGAFIIQLDNRPMGYIQFYNAYDFPRDSELIGLPPSLGAFDMFIGEKDYVGKGVGSTALKLFLKKFGNPKFTHIFADPDAQNIAAIKCYEKAGFKRLEHPNPDSQEIWMLYEIN